MCSETSSPRLSFSTDAPMEEKEEELRRRDTSLVDCEDFEFSFTTSLSLSQSSADQLFSHGIIIPTQPTKTIPNNTCSSSSSSSKSSLLIISNKNSSEDDDQQAKITTPQTKTTSFWGGFKRSTSLNCEKSKKSGLLFSLPPILSRSNSTGSVPKKTSPQKQPLISTQRSSSSSSLKPPLKKKGYYGNNTGNNGVRVIPVINVPPPYISKGTAKLFGLGSFLHHGKHRPTTTINK